MAFSSPEHFKSELARKLLHLPTLVFPAIALYSRNLAIVILSLLIVFYLILDFSKLRHLILPFKRKLGFDPAPVYLALGMIISLVLNKPWFVFYSAYIIAICDSAAALVGKKFGRHQILALSKSFEGSASFLALSFLGALIFLAPAQALLAAALLTIVEALSIRGLDNLALPVLAQLILLAFR